MPATQTPGTGGQRPGSADVAAREISVSAAIAHALESSHPKDDARDRPPAPAGPAPEFPGIDLGLLAYDIADLLDRGQYPVDVAAGDIEPALPGFLHAILAIAADSGTSNGHQAGPAPEFPGHRPGPAGL